MDTSSPNNKESKTLNNRDKQVINNIMIDIIVSIGKTRMSVKQILELEMGSIIELDKKVNSPATIYANNKPIAEGELIVLDGQLGINITSLIGS